MSFDVYGDRSFKLTDAFLEQYQGKQPNWGYGDLGYLTYLRTYSRKKKDGALEEWADTCQRVVEGMYNVQKNHCKKLNLPWNGWKAQKSAQEAFRRMWEFKWLPPGRGLWMMGTEFVEQKGGAALNNCGFVTTENIDQNFAAPFCWLMDMSMLGVGVGFDVRGAQTLTICEPLCEAKEVYEIPDTREGWVESVHFLLGSYVGGESVLFDYSQIRPKGEPINGFGGVASGPEPLVELHDAMRKVLNNRVGNCLGSSDIVDMCNLIGKCVVAGNVRRTAEIAFGSPDDAEYLSLKDPGVAQEALVSHRWASNNSVFVEPGQKYSELAAQTVKNGEPGYMWLENAQMYGRMGDEPDFADKKAKGGNPCLEQTLEPFELCCLVETFPAHHEHALDYYKTLKYAYLYAKTVTLIPTHCPDTNQVMMRNRRIGCSQSGIVQAIEKFGYGMYREKFCKFAYHEIQNIDESYSNWLAVPNSIKTTSVKPSGTVSLLAGATPGMHFPHAEHYIRRIRLADNSPLLGRIEAAGYEVEDDVYGTGSKVISIPIKEENYGRCKDDVSLWEQVALAAMLQRCWADNQVSCTATFTLQEAPQVERVLEAFDDQLKGISFLPVSEHGYVQAPYETITSNEYETKKAKLRKLSFRGKKYGDAHEVIDQFCDGASCEVPLVHEANTDD